MGDIQTKADKKNIRVHIWDQMVLIGVGLALFYTVFDSILYIFLSYDVNFFQRLFGPDMSAIWNRIAILCLFIIFGSHAQFAINQRSAAEGALRESEEKFRTIIETAPDGYCEVDMEGNYAFFNDSMCTILGYSRDEISAMNQRDSLDEANLRKLSETRKLVLETGEPVESVEWTLINKDGNKRFVESSLSLINDPKGNPTGFGGFIRDVTQRQRAETLHRAKLAAEAASRTKSKFLASMSHEIRTPLNAIIGLVELMLNSDLSNDQREDLDVVKSSAYSLLSIINNILDFSKIEAGKLEFERTPFSLRHFIDESLKIMGMKAHEKGIELAYRIAPGVPDRLLGDPVRARQVLTNLVDNAIKFTEKGEVVVFVAAPSVTEYDLLLHISVVDTGIGISKGHQRSIFRAYNQGDPGTLRQYGGTGLGLAVSAQLVRLMDGTIRLKSQSGHGSRFRFTARFIRQQDGKTPQKGGPHPALAGLKILVVDDNATSCKILKEMLGSLQMKPVFALGAQKAKDILLRSQTAKAPFNLILLDSDMPETDGFALASWIVHQKITDAAIIEMLTFPHLKRKLELEALGIAGYMVKPLGSLELESVILNALKIKLSEPEIAAKGQRLAIRVPIRSLKILVAEDTPFNQKFIMRLLERWNHQAVLVENGRQALKAFKKGTFDIVLLDVQMPQMDGLEAARAIRETEQKAKGHIPIIAMTAHAIKGDQERCIEAGMDEYISKPIDSDKLFEALEKLTQAPVVSSEAADESATLDEQLLLKAFDGDWSFLEELVEIYLNDYPRIMDELQKAIKEGDSNKLMRSAHSLKGMLRNFQAEHAAEIAFELEKMGKNEKFEGAQAAAESLSAKIAEVDKTLRDILARIAH
ncbi:MAG: response regulator [Desulfobacterales bacterium]|nr:response regulator [Desulfobacterales bacterium]